MSRGKKGSFLGSAGLVAVAALVSPGGALAQTATGPAAHGAALEEIVVTARKRAESLQETPVAVSAVSAEALEHNRLLRIDDLQKAVPSLVIYANPGLVGTPTFSLRGISATDFIPTNENPVAIYVDGVYVARPMGAMFSLTDLDRVEVLRGPQGTLSGRNATAGSIALYTKGPADHFGVEQKLSYGSYNDFLARTRIDTGPIGQTGLSARVAYLHHTTDGYQRNLLTTPSKSPGAIESNAVFFALHGGWGGFDMDYKYDLNETGGLGPSFLVVTATPTWLSFFQRYNPGFQVYPTFQDEISRKVWRQSKDHTEGHSLTLHYDIAKDLEVKSITGYRLQSSKYASILGAYPQLVGNVSISGAPPFSIQNIDISVIPDALIKQRQWSEEVQLTGKYNRLDYVAGLYYFRETALESYHGDGSLSTTVLTPTTGRYGARGFLDFVNEAKSKAIYGQASYRPPVLGDKLEITVGGRYTEDDKHLVQTSPAPGSTVVPIPRDVSRSFANFSADGSIKYQWTRDTMTYFRAAQAYRAGGISARDTTFSPDGYEPEKEISYELGIKTELLDHRLRLNGDIYHTNYRNLQVSTTFTAAQGCLSSTVCSTTINAGAATYNGVEAEANALLTKALQLDGFVGYIDPKYDSFRINPTPTGDIAGLPTTVFGNLAKVTAGASLRYNFDPTPAGDLSMRLGWSYHSKRYFGNQVLPTNFVDATKDPGHHDLSAQIVLANIPVQAIPGATLTASLYGANLLDEHEVLQGIDVGVYGVKAFGPGRTVGFSLTGQYQ
jgi:iron complex outermembrane receptor protein